MSDSKLKNNIMQYLYYFVCCNGLKLLWRFTINLKYTTFERIALYLGAPLVVSLYLYVRVDSFYC